MEQLKDITTLTYTPCFIILKKDLFEKIVKLKEFVFLLIIYLKHLI